MGNHSEGVVPSTYLTDHTVCPPPPAKNRPGSVCCPPEQLKLVCFVRPNRNKENPIVLCAVVSVAVTPRREGWFQHRNPHSEPRHPRPSPLGIKNFHSCPPVTRDYRIITID